MPKANGFTKQLYNLEPGKTLELDCGPSFDHKIKYTRVPGGWIVESYTRRYDNAERAMTFIPFNNEFMVVDK